MGQSSSSYSLPSGLTSTSNDAYCWNNQFACHPTWASGSIAIPSVKHAPVQYNSELLACTYRTSSADELESLVYIATYNTAGQLQLSWTQSSGSTGPPPNPNAWSEALSCSAGGPPTAVGAVPPTPTSTSKTITTTSKAPTPTGPRPVANLKKRWKDHQ